MSPEGWVLVIGAAGTQLGMLISALKTSRSVGKQNGLGTVHEALTSMDAQLKALCERLRAVEEKVGT